MHCGPFSRTTLNESFLLLLMFMISMAIPSLALSADVTRRQLAQQHHELLLRELSHRVGNTLAVLNSIFRRSARHASSVRELEEAFQARLMNLAAVHKMLGDQNWGPASLRDLVKVAVEPYCPPEYGGCEFEGDDVLIPTHAVTSLTMILHELATNAAKHGGLKSKDGKLKVTWRQESNPTKQIQLHWEEAVSEALPPPNKSGYGTTLIDSTVQALRGSVERLHREGGVSVHVTLQLE
jgi:two-component sensor histidine kinase